MPRPILGVTRTTQIKGGHISELQTGLIIEFLRLVKCAINPAAAGENLGTFGRCLYVKANFPPDVACWIWSQPGHRWTSREHLTIGCCISCLMKFSHQTSCDTWSEMGKRYRPKCTWLILQERGLHGVGVIFNQGCIKLLNKWGGGSSYQFPAKSPRIPHDSIVIKYDNHLHSLFGKGTGIPHALILKILSGRGEGQSQRKNNTVVSFSSFTFIFPNIFVKQT